MDPSSIEPHRPHPPPDPPASPSGSNLLHRQLSKCSLYEDSGGEDEHEETTDQQDFVPSPLVSLQEQLQLDKEDDSLQRWKEKLLGSFHLDHNEECVEPEVKVLSLSILCNGSPDLNIPLPLPENNKVALFSLKEGSCYSLKFTFIVRHNIVSGLTYINTVWKGGVQVDQSRVMLGTFSPHREPYTHIMDDETTPSGVLARGTYIAKTKFVDDDNRCYLEADYSFEIRKD